MNDITAQAGINEDLLSRISAQAEDKEMCLTARELIKRGLIRKNNADDLNQLFILLNQNILKTDFNSRFTQEALVVFSRNKSNEVADTDELMAMATRFCLYTVIWSDVSIEHFNELTNSRFADHSVIKNGSALQLNGLEWKVLMRTIFGYATGYHPVYLSEMKLTSYEIAALSLSIPEKENTLSKADIINFIPDQDGVTYRAVANARTLTWILNRNDELQL